jgi:Predicted SAM-dependent methyltransferase
MKNKIKISKRLLAVVSMVNIGNRVADIGTDHGYVPISLIQRGIAPFVIAMDIGKGPLERAKKNILENELTDKIETRLSNGVRALNKSEVDSILISGMGGELIADILKSGSEILKDISELVLSPQSEIFKVRELIRENGFTINKEMTVYDEGKYYTVIHAVRGNESSYTKAETIYGKLKLNCTPEVMHRYLQKEIKHYETIIERIQKESLLEGEEGNTYNKIDSNKINYICTANKENKISDQVNCVSGEQINKKLYTQKRIIEIKEKLSLIKEIYNEI